ncbi:biotin carboxylase, partial [bacterium]|nr:biotin carboxylase [bacterium]
MSYFQGRRSTWQEPDVAALAHVVPVERVRVYDVRRAIDGIADRDSVLELRRDFGVGILTSLARISGRPVGIVAN